MRLLTIIVATVAALYSGYWFIGARSVEAGANDAIENLRNDGWNIAVSEVATRGYPSRFDTTLDAVSITSADQSFSYKAPFLQALALSYAPNEVIFAFANEHQITIGGQTLDIQSQGLRASASVQANAAASLNAITAEVQPITILSHLGWQVSVEKILAALRPAPELPLVYDTYVEANEVLLPKELQDLLGQVGNYAPSFQSAVIDLRITLDRPLDRHALRDAETNPPVPQAMSLRKVALNWGDMDFSASGDLTFDQNGIPTGTIDLDLGNWEQIIQTLALTGAIQPGLVPVIESVGQNLANGNDRLSVAINFQGGQMLLGPWPLGPAPRLF